MLPWVLGCIALVAAVIVLVVKIVFLYHDLKEISGQFGDRLREDTNNIVYVPGNDRYLKAFSGQINKELGILYEKRRRYQNGDRELKEAVTNISHDLRTPLTAIYGYLELLETELKSETVAHYLAQIRNRADAMKELTEELFRYSIIASERENRGGEKNAESVVINRILADCLLSYYDIFGQNRIEPEIRIPDEEIVRFLDAGALRRVFGNILDNAIKYSKPAHHVSENSQDVSSKKIMVELFPHGTIIFRNTVQNLDRVSVERLFDRFYTVETGRNSTGLGLSIAKLLTERMGGSISAEYEENALTIKLVFR